jgi:hypothetical protein
MVRCFTFDEWIYLDGPITQGILRILSAQHRSPQDLSIILEYFKTSLNNLSLLADFLFFVNSVFIPPVVGDPSLMDKR